MNLPFSRPILGLVLALAVLVATLGAFALFRFSDPSSPSAGIGYSNESNLAGTLTQTIIDPAVKGSNDFHLYTLTPGGAVTPVSEISMTITHASGSGSPIDVPLQRLSADHAASYGYDVPEEGEWTVTVTVKALDGTVESVDLGVPFQ